jgi:asparagine synthetase B (glutamine-hydrolysing)
MYPHKSEMDLSIALALYFASRGVGYGYTGSGHEDLPPHTITTPARVLLSGLGADELFGGYSRHEVAFKREGYAGLIDELKLDVSRIGERNLGRDDRILSSWGKEVRFPFLDEDFIKFALERPVWEKCDFANRSHHSNIEPAKRVLRLLADQLNLPSTAREKKRAVSSVSMATDYFADSSRSNLARARPRSNRLLEDPRQKELI